MVESLSIAFPAFFPLLLDVCVADVTVRGRTSSAGFSALILSEGVVGLIIELGEEFEGVEGLILELGEGSQGKYKM